MSKVRLVILGFAALTLVAVGIGMGIQFLLGKGTVYVVEPGWAKTTQDVLIDGKGLDVTGEGNHRRYELSKGSHTLTLVDAQTKKQRAVPLKISNGFTEVVVPAEEDQCVVDMDMTSGYGENSHFAPTVRGRYQDGPFDRPSSSYWSVKELPKEIDEHGTASVLINVPCSVLSLPDAKIAELLLSTDK